MPGVGPIVAITFTPALGDLTRFANFKSLCAYFGVKPKKDQSGDVDCTGRISNVGDGMVRTALFKAAMVLLTRTTRFLAQKAWAVQVAGRVQGPILGARDRVEPRECKWARGGWTTLVRSTRPLL